MQIVYSKYSRSRRPEYQIVTLIESDGENKVVWKKALTPEARPHIERMFSNYKTLCEIYGKDHVAKADITDEDTVRFDYVEGLSWGTKIANIGYNKGKQEFFLELRQYYRFLEEGKSIRENSNIDFSAHSFDGKLVDIDMHPDNPDAPISFVFQRSMFNFYYNFHHSLLENVATIEEIWEEFDITQDKQLCYSRLEKAFFDAVGTDSFMNRYQKKNVCFDDVFSLKKQAKKRILGYISNLTGK